MHPIAKATVNYNNIDSSSDNSISTTTGSLDVKNYKVEHGKGVEGEINGEVFRFGTESWAIGCRRWNANEEKNRRASNGRTQKCR